jgi:hypothetical protein
MGMAKGEAGMAGPEEEERVSVCDRKMGWTERKGKRGRKERGQTPHRPHHRTHGEAQRNGRRKGGRHHAQGIPNNPVHRKQTPYATCQSDIIRSSQHTTTPPTT